MKSTVVDESLSSFKPMYCSREYQASTRLSQQYEKSTSKKALILLVLIARNCYKEPYNEYGQNRLCKDKVQKTVLSHCLSPYDQ